MPRRVSTSPATGYLTKGMTRCVVPFALIFLLFAGACSRHSSAPQSRLTPGVLPDTLRVATLYGPTSYFVFRDEPMGYDYNLVNQLGQDKNMVIDLTVAYSLGSMIEMLDSGKVDLIAFEVPVTAEYREYAVACGPENSTSQVLVQPKGNGLITDVTELSGKDVYVEKGSKYQYRLQNLNEEIGGGINIHPIDKDTISGEDLIGMVSSGDIPLTVVDSDVARLNRTYFRNIDISLEISFPQRSRWAVSPASAWLADTIDAWINQAEPRRTNAALLRRYFELSKQEDRSYSIDFSKGYISQYDNLFKKYADSIDWDWRLLAMQGYAESRFDTAAVSWAGARGIMQIMPAPARAFGLEPSKMADAEANIATAVKILQGHNMALRSEIPDDSERLKFVLASYNSGLAHILDAISIAKETGKNPQLWDGNVADALLMKSQPEIYNNKDICRYGYFRGRQTTSYVKTVMQLYSTACDKIPR